MNRNEFKRIVNKYAENWNPEKSIRKKEIQDAIKNLFEEIQDGIVDDIREEMGERSSEFSSEKDMDEFEDIVNELVEEWIISKETFEFEGDTFPSCTTVRFWRGNGRT